MKKDMKRLMGLLLLITMLAQCLPVFAEEAAEAQSERETAQDAETEEKE